VDAKAALMHAHRNNIRRYRRLLETHLTDNERLLRMRLSEERADPARLHRKATFRSVPSCKHRNPQKRIVRLVDVLLKFPYLAK
jgi:hypothetical protein